MLSFGAVAARLSEVLRVMLSEELEPQTHVALGLNALRASSECYAKGQYPRVAVNAAIGAAS